jgi:hypothetical protein
MIEIVNESKAIQGVFMISTSVLVSGLICMASVTGATAAAAVSMPITFIAIGAVGVAVSAVWAVTKAVRWVFSDSEKKGETARLIIQ